MKIIFDDWLKENTDVVGKEPAYTRKIEDSVDLELYTGEAHGDPEGWVTAVIAVKTTEGVYRFKYDSGRIEDGLVAMANDCEHYIKFSGLHSVNEWIIRGEKALQDAKN